MTSPPPGQPPPSSLLDPASLQRLGALELIARHVVDGYLQGLHRSPHVGFAMDFAHHRPYSPGDDVRRIDWRAYARTERFYLKQHEVSTNLRAHILLDSSGSMAYQGEGDAVSKLRYAQILSASIAYLILRQKDSAGLVTFDHRLRENIPPSSVPSHLPRLISVLESTQPGGESSIAPLLHDLASRIRSRGMVILLSDLFDHAPAIIDSLHHLRREGHDVLLLQILSPDEKTFPFRSWTTFENLENPSVSRRLDPAVVRSLYLKNLRTHQDQLRHAADRLGVRYALLATSDPLDVALAKCLG